MAISKTVLVTGCSTGIGRAAAERLQKKGWRVYATARRIETIKDLAEAGMRVLPLDVNDEDSMRAAVASVEEAEGAVGVLVNNAGFGLQGPFEEFSMEDVRRQFETNVFGLVRLTQLALPGMRRQGWGRIVNVSSVGGRLSFPGGSFYHGTKWAVEAISDSLRLEVGGFGVRVVLVEPGTVITKFGDTALATVPGASDGGPYGRFKQELQKTVKDAYEGRMARLAITPEKVAAVIDKAISARRPRARYPVSAATRLLFGLKRVLPGRALDAVIRSQFTLPSPKDDPGKS